MHSSVLRFAQRLFLGVGFVMLVYVAGTASYAGIYQRYLSWTFEQEVTAPKVIKAGIVDEVVDLREGDLHRHLHLRHDRDVPTADQRIP